MNLLGKIGMGKEELEEKIKLSLWKEEEKEEIDHTVHFHWGRAR